MGMGIVLHGRESSAGTEPVISYVLRQLKVPLSNINRLAYNLSVSTGTFVILYVIPDQVCLLSSFDPPVGYYKHDFKTTVKDLLIVVVIKGCCRLFSLIKD